MATVPDNVCYAARRWLHTYIEEEQRWTLAFAVLALVAVPVVVIGCVFALAAVAWVGIDTRHFAADRSFGSCLAFAAIVLAFYVFVFWRKSERERDLQSADGCVNAVLYLPGHALFAAWRQWRRLVGLGYIDRDGCAAILALSFVAERSLHVGEIQRALPDVDAYAALAGLRLIPEVRFSSAEPDTLYLGHTLRQALEAYGA